MHTRQPERADSVVAGMLRRSRSRSAAAVRRHSCRCSSSGSTRAGKSFVRAHSVTWMRDTCASERAHASKRACAFARECARARADGASDTRRSGTALGRAIALGPHTRCDSWREPEEASLGDAASRRHRARGNSRALWDLTLWEPTRLARCCPAVQSGRPGTPSSADQQWCCRWGRDCASDCRSSGHVAERRPGAASGPATGPSPATRPRDFSPRCSRAHDGVGAPSLAHARAADGACRAAAAPICAPASRDKDEQRLRHQPWGEAQAHRDRASVDGSGRGEPRRREAGRRPADSCAGGKGSERHCLTRVLK